MINVAVAMEKSMLVQAGGNRGFSKSLATPGLSEEIWGKASGIRVSGEIRQHLPEQLLLQQQA